MQTTPILQTIRKFLNQSSYASLEVTFADHLVLPGQSHLPMRPVYKSNSRIVINKRPEKGLVQMVVVDNLVFNFSFDFVPPQHQEFYLAAMLRLPSPLDQGHLHMDADQLTLSFRIYAKDPKLRVYVSQTYTHIHKLEKFRVPYVLPED
ncbi:hypothetical protein [Flagellimonas myxillae]|uniref:hypothetical protein n=1 Tax=Flagellimonas myxillae TaxID=2942214 RepID=UPI00201E850B|nr:hypothetical protein [Muricauda myxillae]MCL6267649.1 hypothetical protein [Muricauda myxillae]